MKKPLKEGQLQARVISDREFVLSYDPGNLEGPFNVSVYEHSEGKRGALRGMFHARTLEDGYELINSVSAAKKNLGADADLLKWKEDYEVRTGKRKKPGLFSRLAAGLHRKRNIRRG